MPISGKLNPNYKLSDAVTQKYQPLAELTIPRQNAKDITGIIDSRSAILRGLAIDLSAMTFFGDGITDFYKNEKGKLPPLAILSSNRSGWMKAQYAAGRIQLSGQTNYADENDKSVLLAGAIPIYFPYRLKKNSNRNVYVFVHYTEYDAYRDDLKNTGIIVIGWRFSGANEWVGFGACRYVPISFFKAMCKADPKKDKVWLLDDNVVYINGFPGFEEVEKVMSEDPTAYAGLGFKGGSLVKSSEDFIKMGLQMPEKDEEEKSDSSYNPLEHAPILQQAALWNTGLLLKAGFNFSPLFFTCGEDTSFTKFLNGSNCGCNWYKSSDILKGSIPDKKYEDTNMKLKATKTHLLDLMYRDRTAIKINDDKTDLSGFLQTFPAAIKEKNEPVPETYSKAVEQILTTAMDDGQLFNYIKGLFYQTKMTCDPKNT